MDENKIFDRGQWHPVLCKTPEEADQQLTTWGLKEKTIKKINIIGAVHFPQTQYLLPTREDLIAASYSPDPPEWDIGPFIPCQVKACEPVVIVFEDDRTLALLPHYTEGLLMAADQISPDMVDGTNRSNLDASFFFETVQGKTISGIEFITRTGHHETYNERDYDRIYQIRLDYSRNLYLVGDWEGWFWTGLMAYTGRIELHPEWIPYEKAQQACHPLRQVEIVEGHDGGGYFWIMPVRLKRDTEWRVEEYRPEEISIEENDIAEYLAVFLRKYFDKSFPYYEIRDYNYDEFEWYLEYNFYTYDTINRMLEEIECCCELLKHDADDTKLTPLKESASWLSDDPTRHLWKEPLTEEAIARHMDEELQTAIDFYHRFIRRMRDMMERASDYELISFMGP